MGKEIAIFGATGLIGSNIIKLLENDNDFSQVRVVTRRPIKPDRTKLPESKPT